MSFLLRVVDEMQEWGRPRLSDLFSRSPASSIEICKFEENEIDYNISFKYPKAETPSYVNKEEIHLEIKDYFKRKIDSYIMILRSAVDGMNRDLILIFKVIDEIESKKIVYKFVHQKPDVITIHCGYSNNTHCTIEENYNEIDMETLNEKNWSNFCSKVNAKKKKSRKSKKTTNQE